MQFSSVVLSIALLIAVVVVAEDVRSVPSSPTIAAIQPLKSLDIDLIPTSKRGATVPQFDLTIRAFDQEFNFLIERNDDLFTPTAKVLVHNAEGEVVQSYPPARLSYRGVGSQENSIRITLIDVENGLFKGYFRDNNEIYYVDTVEEHLNEMGNVARSVVEGVKLVIYRESDLQEDPQNPINCGFIDGMKNKTEYIPLNSGKGVNKRQTASFAQPLPAFNCPTSQRILIMSVAADATYNTRMSSLGQQPTAFIQAQYNTISGIYQTTVNVKIQLDEILLFPTAGTPTWNEAACGTINDKLYRFSEWRGTRSQNAGLWHLMTDCFRSGTVGLAWIGVLCRKTSSNQGSGQWVSGTGVSSYVSGAGAYRVPAHEIGHNFGAQHTTIGVMVPSNINSDQFQLESQQQMCQEIFNDGACLTSGTCTPNCSGKNCGSNGCGGSCGTCASPSTCSTSGVCQTCTRNCNGKTCGSDGCGGTCGTCATGSTCSSGVCVSTSTGSSQLWVDLHNGARAEYRLNNVSWNTNDAAVAASWAAKCVWAHSTYGSGGRGDRGENIAAFSGTGGTVTSAFTMWANEKADWNCAGNTCTNVCGHYTQIVWGTTSTIGCATQVCTTGSPWGSGSWTFVVCNYAPPGNYVGQRPFDVSKCTATTCTPTTSCAAQGRTCGTINDGCQTVSCGSCGTDTTCNSQGQCVCQPAGTCASAGRQCGSFYDGCSTTNCGTCATGSTCSSSGQCVTDPAPCQPTSTCAAQGKTCGTIWNGCENVQCGGCLVGQSCISGQCTACVGCDVHASCVNNQCQCMSGYTGDGKTCTVVGNVPPGGMEAWEVASGTTTGWKRTGSTMEEAETSSSPAALRLKGSAALVQVASTTWRAQVRRTSSATEAGVFFANSGNNYWAVSITGSGVYLTGWFGTYRNKYTVSTGRNYPVNTWQEVKVTVSQSTKVTVSAGGVTFGTWTLSGGDFSGAVGLYSIAGTAQFNETLLATSSTLSITLVECLTADQFAAKIAGILGIPVSQVQSIGVSSNCNKRQAATANVYTFTLVGSETATSDALASQLSTKLAANHPSIVGNGVTAQSALTTVPVAGEAALITSLPLVGAAAAALSVGAIVGIAVGSAAGVALIGGAAYGAKKLHDSRKEKKAQELEMAENNLSVAPKNGIDLLAPKKHSSITGRGVPQL